MIKWLPTPGHPHSCPQGMTGGWRKQARPASTSPLAYFMSAGSTDTEQRSHVERTGGRQSFLVTGGPWSPGPTPTHGWAPTQWASSLGPSWALTSPNKGAFFPAPGSPHFQQTCACFPSAGSHPGRPLQASPYPGDKPRVVSADLINDNAARLPPRTLLACPAPPVPSEVSLVLRATLPQPGNRRLMSGGERDRPV